MSEVEDIGGSYATANSDGFEVQSNTESAEKLQANLDSDAKEPTDEGKASKAASELGKKGGKASAEAKKAKPGVAAELGTGDDAEEIRDAEPDGRPEGKPRFDPKARVYEATKKAAEYRDQLEAAQREKDRLAAELEQFKAAKAPVEVKKDGPPNPADYDDYEKLQEDRMKYWADQKAQEKLAEWQQEQQRQQQTQAKAAAVGREIQGFQEKVKKAEEASPGIYAEIDQEIWDNLPLWWEAAPGQQLNQKHQIAYELMSSLENPLPLLRYFSKNKPEFQRIATLSDSYAITRELAKLDARLDAATTATSVRPTISTAKPPVRPVTGSPSAVDRDTDSMSFEEFYAQDRKSARR